MTCCKVQPQISNNCTLLNKLIFRCARHFCLLRNLQKIWALNQNYKMMVDDSLLQSTTMQKIPTLRLHLRQLFPQGNLNENHLFFCFIIQTRNLLSLLDVTGEGVCHQAVIIRSFWCQAIYRHTRNILWFIPCPNWIFNLQILKVQKLLGISYLMLFISSKNLPHNQIYNVI